jgi:AcrR family transcriptional regulator
MTTTATDGRRTAAASRRRERRAEIIAATRELFDERGVRDVQIEDVARSVGINRAIIYRHFSGKEELFALTLCGYLEELDARIAEAVTGRRKPMTQLAAAVEAFADFGIEYPAFVDCCLTLMRRPGPELLDEVSESAMFRLGRGITGCMERMADVVRRGNEAGEMNVDDPYQLINTLYAAGLGSLQLARLGITVRPASPGVPTVVALPAEQVKAYMVETAKALTRT